MYTTLTCTLTPPEGFWLMVSGAQGKRLLFLSVHKVKPSAITVVMKLLFVVKVPFTF